MELKTYYEVLVVIRNYVKMSIFSLLELINVNHILSAFDVRW